jgi:hypothetical protein
MLLAGAGDPADLADERDAFRERTGQEVGRDHVVQDAPVTDTVCRVELSGRDLPSHTGQATTVADLAQWERSSRTVRIGADGVSILRRLTCDSVRGSRQKSKSQRARQ